MRELICATLWLLPFFVVAAFQRATPPGSVWSVADYGALAGLLVGGYYTGRLTRKRYVSLFYGCFGALAFIPLLLPDNRDYISIAYGHESVWSYIARCCLFVVGAGLGCRVLGVIGRARYDAKTRRAPAPRCRKCDYLLYGLLEKRCPECGKPFEQAHDIPPDEPT